MRLSISSSIVAYDQVALYPRAYGVIGRISETANRSHTGRSKRRTQANIEKKTVSNIIDVIQWGLKGNMTIRVKLGNILL